VKLDFYDVVTQKNATGVQFSSNIRVNNKWANV
jgi:hypothetical protein